MSWVCEPDHMLRHEQRAWDWSLRSGAMRSKVPVMPRNLPVEEHIFHFGASANVVHDHVAASKDSLPVHDHADVRQSAPEVPCHQVSGSVIPGAICNRQALTFSAEEHHQI